MRDMVERTNSGATAGMGHWMRGRGKGGHGGEAVRGRGGGNRGGGSERGKGGEHEM
jgi:hypothetical protein